MNNKNKNHKDVKQTPFFRPWQPKPSLNVVVLAFIILGIWFVLVGVYIMQQNNQVNEIELRYDDVCKAQFRTGNSCKVNINVADKMEGPIFFYYKLTNFYQNVRRYAQSKSIYQMQNHAQAKQKKIKVDCYPIVSLQDMWQGMSAAQQAQQDTYLASIGKTRDQVTANPCGLVAKTYFNDTFSIDNVKLNESKIAWSTDSEKFNVASNNVSQWMDVSNEHFMVWARISGTTPFRKLWARVDENIEVGTYTLNIVNNYDNTKYNGEKYIVMSTASMIGGKNPVLVYAYFFVGVMCFWIGFTFLIKKKAAGEYFGITKFE